jgi:hypothetical protein
MNPFCLRLLLVAVLSTSASARVAALCIDSVHYHVVPPRCYNERGALHIDSVFTSENAQFSVDSVSFSTNPVIPNLLPGQHKLYVRNLAGDTCIYVMPFIVPQPEPLQVVLFASATKITSGEYVDLQAEIAPDNTALDRIHWRPPQYFPDSTALFQRIRPRETETFHLILHDTSRCRAAAQVTIEVEESAVFVPNVFAPGSLANAIFTVFADDGVAQIEWLRVYNRTGSLVFQRERFAPNDPSLGWDGRWKGRPVAPGVYCWSGLVRYWDGREKPIQGDVTVVR